MGSFFKDKDEYRELKRNSSSDTIIRPSREPKYEDNGGMVGARLTMVLKSLGITEIDAFKNGILEYRVDKKEPWKIISAILYGVEDNYDENWTDFRDRVLSAKNKKERNGRV